MLPGTFVLTPFHIRVKVGFDHDCDSMYSISLTVVVIARSETVTIRFSISSGEIPVNDDHRDIYVGEDVGRMTNAANPPNRSIKSAITTKVYAVR